MLDFRPDLDPRTPGILTAVSEMVPTPRGYRAAQEELAIAFTYTLVANEVWPNMLFATRWNSTPGGIVIAGTNKKLNILHATGGYIDVSKGGGYALGGQPFLLGEDAAGAFDICAYGDVIIATNKDAPAQKRDALDLTGGTLFSDLGNFTAAPQGNTCCVAANFVFIGDVGNWSTVTGASDILAWSGIGDHTDWRVNPQVTQSSYAQFVDTPGPITAVRPFRDGIIVFKVSSMYRGRYVGAGPNSPIWDFERISDKIGCIGHRSVTITDTGLVFVGMQDIYIYDGTRPTAITAGIHNYIGELGMFTGAGKIPLLLAHARLNNSIWVCGLEKTLVWNYEFNRWGALSLSQSAQPIPCQTNVDELRTETVSSVSSGIPALTESSNWINLSTLRLFNGVPMNRNGGSAAGHYLTTGWFGQPDKLQTVQRINPVFSVRPAPVNAGVTIYPSVTPGEPTSSGGGTPMNASYRFDTLGPITGGNATSNFFSFKLAFGASSTRTEIVDIGAKFVAAGER